MTNIKNSYSFIDYIAMIFFLFRSKLLDKNIRLIRFPIDIRGKKYIDFGNSLTTGRRCRFDVFGNKEDGKKLIFGSNVQLNDAVHIVCMDSVVIGDNTIDAASSKIHDRIQSRFSSVRPINLNS